MVTHLLEEPEKSWIQGCLENNRKAQFALYNWSFPYLMQVVMRYCKQEEDARSLTNQAFLKVLQTLETYDAQRPFIPWIRTIAIRLAIDAHRQGKRDPLVFQGQEDEREEAVVPAEIMLSIDLEHIEAALKQLDATDRMVFNLFVIEGYSHAEIADFLEISERTSKRCLQRAKENLRQRLMADRPKSKAV